MKLVIFSLVLDGMPWLPMQLVTFNRLGIDWEWLIIEGQAANTGSTRWCRPMDPRLSRDGSTEVINSLRKHPRVKIWQSQMWRGGKDEMVQTAVNSIKEPCVLMQIDIDEFYEPGDLEEIVYDFVEFRHFDHMRFPARYFLGWNIVATGENCYGNNPGEWVRAWRFAPGMRVLSHEPPVFEGATKPQYKPTVVMNHYSWVLPQQVAAKEAFYGYDHALEHWIRLQNNKSWPVKRLKAFLPWVDERAGADLLHK